MPTLLLTPRQTDDTQKLWRACITENWRVERVHNWRVPEVKPEDVEAYGEHCSPITWHRRVVATDGLWKYTSPELIEQRVRAGNPEHLAAELAELVRLCSGAFPDDIAIATCRITA